MKCLIGKTHSQQINDPNSHWWAFIATLLILMSSAAFSKADDTTARLTLVDQYSTSFANKTIPFRVQATGVRDGAVQCVHSAAGRTISRQEVTIKRNEPVRFELKLPPVRDGITFSTTLTFTLLARGNSTPVDTLAHELWLFPPNPITGQRESLEALNITLFDPDGATDAVFQEIDLPFKRVRSLPEPPATDDDAGVLVIGEGVSLRRQRSLMPQLFTLALKGTRIVILAPEDGAFEIPGLGGDGVASSVHFHRSDVIKQFDKRFDATSWIGVHGSLPATGLAIESTLGRIKGVVTHDAAAWPWLNIQMPMPSGSVTYCGLRLISNWKSGPTPRFLLIKMLQSLARNESATERDSQ